jgi:hypothetical protein
MGAVIETLRRRVSVNLRKVEEDAMSEQVYYKCVRCLETFVVPPDNNCPECECIHVLEVHVGAPGSESTQPILAADGHPKAHAPRWWIFRNGPYGRRI